MQIHIKYFGLVADRTGISEETMVLEDGATAAGLMNLLGKKYNLDDCRLSLAVNRKLAPGKIRLSENDVVALLPPFAGG